MFSDGIKKINKLIEPIINQQCLKRVRIRKIFWSVSSSIWIEYGEMRSISPYSVRMLENMDQKNFEYGHFSRSGVLPHNALYNGNICC